MRKTITYNDLKEVKTNIYRRVIIFSEKELYIFKENSFYNYVKSEKIDFIISEYLKCVENTGKTDLPYLFIFNKVEVENEEFLESCNWLRIVKDELLITDDFIC